MGSRGAAQMTASRLAVRNPRALSRPARLARLQLELKAAAASSATETTKTESAATKYWRVQAAGHGVVEVEAIFCRAKGRTAGGASAARRSELRSLSTHHGRGRAVVVSCVVTFYKGKRVARFTYGWVGLSLRSGRPLGYAAR